MQRYFNLIDCMACGDMLVCVSAAWINFANAASIENEVIYF